jgi:hypothetical protein
MRAVFSFMPAPDSVTFKNETTEKPKIQHKVQRSSGRNEIQSSGEVAASVKSSCLAIHPREKRFA